jgi:hypothetical protein
MSNREEIVSVVISTRKIDDNYLKHVEKMFSHPKTQILIYENDGISSLPEIYNEGLNEATNDIIVFMHDDLILETKNITPKIIKLFETNPDYGVIGLAGTDNLLSGMWWQDRTSMYGVVGHEHEGKRHVNHYSKESYSEKLKEVMKTDRAKHKILPMSPFGLIQITRQRVRPEMAVVTNEKCPSCMGSGEIQSSVSIVDDIERR